MKAQFDKVKKLARLYKIESAKLDEMIMEKYGFHYSETNDDEMIDSLDYGIYNISFQKFENKMNQYKEDFDNDRKFRAI